MADPFTQALMAFGPSIIGTKQLGGIAPPISIGGLFGKRLTPDIDEDKEPSQTPFIPTLPADTNVVPEFFRAGSTPPVDTTNDEIMAQDPRSTGDNGFMSRFNNFFGNLDQHLESPSKIIGLGLLNQIDPRLTGPALIAGGLFGNRRVF